MDEIQKEYAAFISREVKENANPYPTAIQAFRAGIEAERERIIALLENECFCDSINPYHQKSCDACQYVALLRGENE